MAAWNSSCEWLRLLSAILAAHPELADNVSPRRVASFYGNGIDSKDIRSCLRSVEKGAAKLREDSDSELPDTPAPRYLNDNRRIREVPNSQAMSIEERNVGSVEKPVSVHQSRKRPSKADSSAPKKKARGREGSDDGDTDAELTSSKSPSASSHGDEDQQLTPETAQQPQTTSLSSCNVPLPSLLNGSDRRPRDSPSLQLRDQLELSTSDLATEVEEGWVPTSAQRSSSQQELDRSTATRTQKALGSYIRRSPSPDVPFYLLSSSAAPPSSITNQQNSSPDSGRASLFTSPLAQDLPPKIDRISSPSFHVHSQCSYGDHANSNNERVQTSNVPAGDSQDDPQSPLTIPECVLPLPRVQPSQTTRAPTWSFVTPVSQLPDQQRDRRDIPRIYPRNVDNKEPGRALGEPPSYQLSDSLQTAANNIPDELAFRSQEEILLPRPTSSSWKASQYGYSDRESEAKDDEDHEDDNIDQSEDDCGYGEDEEWNENVRPEECDWGQNGESGPADWDRINAEDQAFLNANGVHAGLREDDDLTGNHDVKPPGRHGEATINEADYSKDSEEEERAIEHQLRLSQRSSEQIDNLTQHESKADARDHTSAAKGKGRASDSQSRATYASKVPKNRRLHNAKLSNPASRRSSNSGPPHTGNRSPYFPVVHDQSNVTFPSGSPKLGNAGGPSSQARTNSPRSSQPCLPSQQREGQRRQAPSQPSTQSQQGQVQTQQRRVSSNQARPASGQPQKPHPSSNQSRHASSSQPTHHATPGPSTRPRNPTRHASQFISINKTVKQEPDATIQPQTEQGEGRRSKQKEEERKRNLELVRKSEEWEWKYGSGRLAVVQGHGQEENEDQDDSGSDSHGEREFVVEQDDESGTSKSESESSSEEDEEEDFSDDDLTGLGTRVVVSESDSTTSSSSSEDEDEGERVVETRRRRGFY